MKGVTSADYPLISGSTLVTTLMVLVITFVLDIIYGFIDPRVKAASWGSRSSMATPDRVK